MIIESVVICRHPSSSPPEVVDFAGSGMTTRVVGTGSPRRRPSSSVVTPARLHPPPTSADAPDPIARRRTGCRPRPPPSPRPSRGGVGGSLQSTGGRIRAKPVSAGCLARCQKHASECREDERAPFFIRRRPSVAAAPVASATLARIVGSIYRADSQVRGGDAADQRRRFPSIDSRRGPRQFSAGRQRG